MNLSQFIMKWLSIGLLCMTSVNSFAALQSHQEKFIKTVLTEVRTVNLEVQLQRTELKALYNKWRTSHALSDGEKQKVLQLATHYKVKDTDLDKDASWQKLLQRIDVLPESLVLAQAINESAWGKSRIAQNINNYFGRECFKKGCGSVPSKARKAKFEYKRFTSLTASLRDYLHNINTHNAYDGLRKNRHLAHATEKKLSGTKLATGLRRYSERGPVYIARLQQIIKNYKLDQFDTV